MKESRFKVGDKIRVVSDPSNVIEVVVNKVKYKPLLGCHLYYFLDDEGNQSHEGGNGVEAIN